MDVQMYLQETMNMIELKSLKLLVNINSILCSSIVLVYTRPYMFQTVNILTTFLHSEYLLGVLVQSEIFYIDQDSLFRKHLHQINETT
jgi:hypothetical protein